MTNEIVIMGALNCFEEFSFVDLHLNVVECRPCKRHANCKELLNTAPLDFNYKECAQTLTLLYTVSTSSSH